MNKKYIYGTEEIMDAIIYKSGAGKIEEALQLAREHNYTDIEAALEKSIEHTKNIDLYRSYYESEHRSLGEPQILGKGCPDRRQQAALSLLSGGNLLDIGCADGSFCFFALERDLVNNVTGVDPRKNGIKWAQQYGDEHYKGRTTFIQGLFEDIALEEKYDIVHMGEILEHVLEPIEVVKKALQTVTENFQGIIITVPFISPYPKKNEEKILGLPLEHLRCFNIEMVSDLAKQSNLKIVSQQIIETEWVNLVALLK